MAHRNHGSPKNSDAPVPQWIKSLIPTLSFVFWPDPVGYSRVRWISCSGRYGSKFVRFATLGEFVGHLNRGQLAQWIAQE